MTKYDILRYCLNLFELLACITGFINWHKLKDSYWKWFPVYLGCLFLGELAGEYLILINDLTANGKLYRFIIIPGQFLFFFWLFYRFLRDQKERYWPLLGALGYVLCFVAEIAFVDNTGFWFFSFSYIAGNIALLMLIILFFLKLVRNNDILQYNRNMMFWICAGLLIFYMGSLPFYGLWNTLRNKYKDVFNVYWQVQIGFDYLMYLFFSFGFIWGKKPK